MGSCGGQLDPCWLREPVGTGRGGSSGSKALREFISDSTEKSACGLS